MKSNQHTALQIQVQRIRNGVTMIPLLELFRFQKTWSSVSNKVQKTLPDVLNKVKKP